MFGIIISLLIFPYVIYRLYQIIFPTSNINPCGKYVLVSGCDSGFGHTLVIELDKQGFNVFASVYNQENQVTLKNVLSSRATVFCLDITQPAQIDAAYKMVKEKTNTLHALVNNAGIDQDNYIDWISMDFMRNMMEVNFFGHVAMTKTFLPLLISKRDSRVVNLCSVAGYLVAPGMAAYCASKYALESFSDCLRREMHPWGLHVSIIEPSYMRTPIIEGHVQTMQKIWDRLPGDVKDRWGENFLRGLMNKRLNNIAIHFAEDPIKVVHTMQHAVINTAPCIRYRPGWQSSLLFFPLSMSPAWLADLIIDKGQGASVQPAGVCQQLKE
jgi:NAD(P)-dependent dehydrogenase (short-subunit alcohol dehydrogenase family)